MVSLLRNGTRMLLAAAPDRVAALGYLASAFGAETMSLDTVFDRSEEYHTIVYLGPDIAGPFKKATISDAVLIRRDPVSLLCALARGSADSPIAAIRPAPHTLIMRSIGDARLMLERIREDLGGVIGGFDACMENGDEDATIVGLTERPLNRSASLSDLSPHFLRLDGDYPSIRRELKMHAFGYVNGGLGSKSWYEMEIRIFDSFGAYKLHYDRLVEVLDALELGLVLGEAWSKDYPLALMAVEVYSLRFYSYLEPRRIKRVLFGLEHLADGRRIVDYDLYHRSKKVYWAELLEGKAKAGRERKVEAGLAREELYARLDEATKAKLASLELQVLRSREGGGERAHRGS